MANFTRQAITDMLWSLLAEKPIDRITVSEICSNLHISRNTFYYHFGDIYEVVEEAFTGEEARLAAESSDIDTIEQGLLEAMRFARANLRAVRHLYDSTQRDRLMGYLHRAAQISMGSLMEERAARVGASQKDVEGIAYLYACLVEGVVVDLMRTGGDRDTDDMIARSCRYLEGTVDLALENATRSSRDAQGAA